MTTQLQQLIDLGQSPWYDNIRRSYITSGWLQALMAGGIRGVTVNPTIFERAILDSTDYDAAMRISWPAAPGRPRSTRAC